MKINAKTTIDANMTGVCFIRETLAGITAALIIIKKNERKENGFKNNCKIQSPELLM